MEKTIFAFIWKHSRRDQVILLGVTLLTFPFLYATLELPKRIINDAIGAESTVIEVLGVELSQVQFLLALCFGFLAAVLAHGLLKMRLNTMKGVVAERMLRRLRYTLIARMMRFPSGYFRKTSQGELVSMVTSEAEPMGGLMGDALAQPVFQAGQMIIIVAFLFAQSVWFGLAGVALIPLQAYLIPMIQRQINQLNKERIGQIRTFSSEIGETAAGITDLRVNGGVRYRLALFTARLGKLFEIRFKIFRKKFFMKFLNNFITQLTPFFFYAVGGYLVIRGEISVGALVAALAAYKDLSSPWKELLAYYNQVQDMALRWQIVTERFAPKSMLDEALFEGMPKDIPHLNGDITLGGVTVRTEEGAAILEEIDVVLPAGKRIAIVAANQSERQAMADLLTREVLPFRGTVRVGEYDLSGLHQGVIATRIGYAHSRPYLFDGTLGSNVLMPLRSVPVAGADRSRAQAEARRSGNSTDPLDEAWTNPACEELASDASARAWWFELVQAMGIDEFMFRRMLRARIEVEAHKELAEAIVGLRQDVLDRLDARGLTDVVNRFDPDQFNPSVPLGGNLLFASPIRDISQTGLAAEKDFLALIAEQGLTPQTIAISQTIVETLDQTFGRDGTQHPLFTKLGIDEELYERLVAIAARRRDKGDQALDDDEFALLLTVPFAFTAEQIGEAFPEAFKEEILSIRKTAGEELRTRTAGMFIPVAPENYLPRLSILENALYGRVSAMAGAKAEAIEDVVAELLVERDMRQLVAETVFDIETGLGGTNLPTIFHERAAFSRAGIKRPDILILDRALASHSAQERRETQARLREILPDATLIFMENSIEDPDAFDMVIELKDGRIDGVQRTEATGDSNDLDRKRRAIAETELFGQLDMRNQRLLAFAATWYSVPAGTRIFSQHETADAAYLCVSGAAQMSYDGEDGITHNITEVTPGRVFGDLAIIVNEPRQLDLTATQDSVFLRIAADDFRAVYESDRTVLLHLLRTVGGHLTELAGVVRSSGIALNRYTDTTGFDPSK
ncbi:MAG: ABC transporter transmembrane domain-containing protein [Pseudomonadota bacterium]